MIAKFDQLNALRRTVVWGMLRKRYDNPPKDHHSFKGHEAILEAIEQRDADASLQMMKAHLHSVSEKLFPSV